MNEIIIFKYLFGGNKIYKLIKEIWYNINSIKKIDDLKIKK